LVRRELNCAASCNHGLAVFAGVDEELAPVNPRLGVRRIGVDDALQELQSLSVMSSVGSGERVPPEVFSFGFPRHRTSATIQF
jgi:hypothetical protein